MTQHSAIIALTGAPNAGKSTLLNALIGAKISIVTPKVQTTRARITGIVTEGNTQLVFVDTPGIFKPKKTLDKSMVKAAWDGMKGADFNCLLVDAKKGITEETKHIASGMASRGGVNVLILNKIDLVQKHLLLALTAGLHEILPFDHTFMICALDREGVRDMKEFFLKNAPEHPFMYPEDQVSDISDRLFSAEITREKLMMSLKQELPYQLMVHTESWEETAKTVKVHQTIYVATESQKSIVVGKGGQMLKSVGEKARLDLGRQLGKRVSLFLFVKVDPRWMESPEHFRMQGLEG